MTRLLALNAELTVRLEQARTSGRGQLGVTLEQVVDPDVIIRLPIGDALVQVAIGIPGFPTA